MIKIISVTAETLDSLNEKLEIEQRKYRGKYFHVINVVSYIQNENTKWAKGYLTAYIEVSVPLSDVVDIS